MRCNWPGTLVLLKGAVFSSHSAGMHVDSRSFVQCSSCCRNPKAFESPRVCETVLLLSFTHTPADHGRPADGAADCAAHRAAHARVSAEPRGSRRAAGAHFFLAGGLSSSIVVLASGGLLGLLPLQSLMRAHRTCCFRWVAIEPLPFLVIGAGIEHDAASSAARSGQALRQRGGVWHIAVVAALSVVVRGGCERWCQSPSAPSRLGARLGPAVAAAAAVPGVRPPPRSALSTHRCSTTRGVADACLVFIQHVSSYLCPVYDQTTVAEALFFFFDTKSSSPAKQAIFALYISCRRPWLCLPNDGQIVVCP